MQKKDNTKIRHLKFFRSKYAPPTPKIIFFFWHVVGVKNFSTNKLRYWPFYQLDLLWGIINCIKFITCIAKANYCRIFSAKPSRDRDFLVLAGFIISNPVYLVFTQNFKSNSCCRSMTFKPFVTTVYHPIFPKYPLTKIFET